MPPQRIVYYNPEILELKCSGPTSDLLGLTEHMVCVVATQLCPYGVKAVLNNM